MDRITDRSPSSSHEEVLLEELVGDKGVDERSCLAFIRIRVPGLVILLIDFAAIACIAQFFHGDRYIVDEDRKFIRRQHLILIARHD